MDKLEVIKGIGPKMRSSLNKINIYDINDLITHYPFRYEILKRSDPLLLEQDDKIIVDGAVESNPAVFRFKGNMNKMSFRLRTKTLVVNVVIFNRAFLQRNLSINKVITVIGKWDKNKNTIVASDILFEKLSNEPKVQPIYHTTSGLSRKTLQKVIGNALETYKDKVEDYIPDYIIEQYNFLDKSSSLQMIHNPTNISDLKKAMIRLKYEELFMFMLKINALKLKNQEMSTGYARKVDRDKVEIFIKRLPFNLTKDQITAVNEIINDIEDPKRMNRLLQGDVGSGKTIVALIAAYSIYLSGYQAAMMVPTEILARQHYDNASEILKGTGMVVELLIGSFSKKEKQKIYERLERGEIDLIIGTHTLIQEEVKYKNLGLVITDEQHRFGVNQRSDLKQKADIPEVLYMSATPIPRTYALTIYGDMEISNIKTIPSGRKPVMTYLKSTNEIKEVLHMIKKELDYNHQIYVVAPLIEESEKVELENVDQLKHKFELAFGKLYKIGMLHGKMNSSEKEKVMTKFSANEINILISTTVIEVGVDVKNATMMVIFDAERFGLSTLHQLRGRVGRSDLQSYCVLISDSEHERLKTLTETNDGFEISESDFKYRGQGDIFGVRQSGDMSFKIADLRKDYKILLQAKEDSMKFIKSEKINDFVHIKKIINNSINLD